MPYVVPYMGEEDQHLSRADVERLSRLAMEEGRSQAEIVRAAVGLRAGTHRAAELRARGRVGGRRVFGRRCAGGGPARRVRRVTLIVDAAPLVALGDSRDRLHGAVGDVLRAEGGDLVVPAAVSAEVDYLIRRRGSAAAARAFLRDVAAGRFRVEGLTADVHGTAARLDEQYTDLDLGLADLSVVILAHRFRTRRLLTFDERDFRAVTPLAGGSFAMLPRDSTGG